MRFTDALTFISVSLIFFLPRGYRAT